MSGPGLIPPDMLLPPPLSHTRIPRLLRNCRIPEAGQGQVRLTSAWPQGGFLQDRASEALRLNWLRSQESASPKLQRTQSIRWNKDVPLILFLTSPIPQTPLGLQPKSLFRIPHHAHNLYLEKPISQNRYLRGLSKYLRHYPQNRGRASKKPQNPSWQAWPPLGSLPRKSACRGKWQYPIHTLRNTHTT